MLLPRLLASALLLTGLAATAAPVEGPTAPSGEKFAGQGTKVLLLGGGSSHDFEQFFHHSDAAILKTAGNDVAYSANPAEAMALLPQADVLVLSSNQKALGTPEFHQALHQFIAAGHGLVVLHPGAWYNWPKETGFNDKLLGGGSHTHDALGKFTVTVKKPDHPVMKGVPATFEVEDELYNMMPEAGGPEWDVLATTSKSGKSGQEHASVWLVANEHARIVGIALGHDARVHELPAFKAVLTNAVAWTAHK